MYHQAKKKQSTIECSELKKLSKNIRDLTSIVFVVHCPFKLFISNCDPTIFSLIYIGTPKRVIYFVR